MILLWFKKKCFCGIWQQYIYIYIIKYQTFTHKKRCYSLEKRNTVYTKQCNNYFWFDFCYFRMCKNSKRPFLFVFFCQHKKDSIIVVTHFTSWIKRITITHVYLFPLLALILCSMILTYLCLEGSISKLSLNATNEIFHLTSSFFRSFLLLHFTASVLLILLFLLIIPLL